MKQFQSTIANLKLDTTKFHNKKVKLHLKDTKPLTFAEGVLLFVNYLILIFWAIIVVFPVISLIIAAFNVFNPRFVTVTPFVFGVENFTYLFTNSRSLFGQWYLNTILIAVSTMIIATIFVALNGYAYSRFKFRGSKHSLSAVLVLQIIPATASLISLFLIVTLGRQLVGIDPRIMLVIIYSGSAIAGNTFVLKGYLDTISTELDDSARIDGCSNWNLFLRVLAPVAKPVLAIIALWSFLTPFGDVLLPKFVIFNLSETTLPVGLDTFINTEPRHINAGAYAAGALLAGLPPFALFMYLQKFITGGLSEGAVKG